ncbi:resolvase [Vibrio ichthyoenteri ATCC 700023]|uniref:Resolvase n=1 Tax=Vibrio ichthyoenteri ATCC 700023 TaxID=870968 RepID=F9S6Y9_9VIBR|nr:resolvase [Vibrio ichthyoenteri ATCC 700023]
MFIRAYLRASTTDQHADRAKSELQTFANQHGIRIASFYTEHLSGAKLERALSIKFEVRQIL